MKRLSLILALIVIAALLGGAYFFFTKTPSVPAVAENSTDATGFLPAAEEEKPVLPAGLRILSETRVVDFWLDEGDRTIYAIGSDNALYSIATEQIGAAEKIYDFDEGLTDIIPSPLGDVVLQETRTDTGTSFAIISPALQSKIFLPANTVTAAWSPSGKEVAFVRGTAENSRTPAGLYRFVIATKKSSFIGALPLLDINMRWSTTDKIVLIEKTAAKITGRMFTYNLRNKTLTTEQLAGTGLRLRWGSNGAAMAAVFGTHPTMFYLSPANKLSEIADAVTLPDKCAVGSAMLYCGLPNQALKKSGWLLPDDYDQGSIKTTDTLIKIDPVTNSIASSTQISIRADIYHPHVLGQVLYFVNRHDGKLYALDL
jgi:hypothetical protein